MDSWYILISSSVYVLRIVKLSCQNYLLSWLLIWLWLLVLIWEDRSAFPTPNSVVVDWADSVQAGRTKCVLVKSTNYSCWPFSFSMNKFFFGSSLKKGDVWILHSRPPCDWIHISCFQVYLFAFLPVFLCTYWPSPNMLWKLIGTILCDLSLKGS